MSYNATDASFLSVLTVVHKACNIIPQCEKSEISKLAARQPTLRTEVPTACGKAPGTAHSCLQIFTTWPKGKPPNPQTDTRAPDSSLEEGSASCSPVQTQSCPKGSAMTRTRNNECSRKAKYPTAHIGYFQAKALKRKQRLHWKKNINQGRKASSVINHTRATASAEGTTGCYMSGSIRVTPPAGPWLLLLKGLCFTGSQSRASCMLPVFNTTFCTLSFENGLTCFLCTQAKAALTLPLGAKQTVALSSVFEAQMTACSSAPLLMAIHRVPDS
eukprot:1150154-Pelagomonas_calceolata.AAC.3